MTSSQGTLPISTSGPNREGVGNNSTLQLTSNITAEPEHMEPQALLEIRVQRKSHEKSQPPEHHVVLAPTPGWAGSLTSWLPFTQAAPPAKITTFRNPW